MIGAGDTIRFAPGVRVNAGRLEDGVRRESWPVNASAALRARARRPPSR